MNRQSIPVNTKRNHSPSNRAEAIGTSAEWNERTESGLTSSDGNENGKITLNKLSRERENIDIGDTLEMIFYGGSVGANRLRGEHEAMRNPFRCFKSSPEVIRLTLMMYVRYTLSLRHILEVPGVAKPASTKNVNSRNQQITRQLFPCPLPFGGADQVPSSIRQRRNTK